MLDLNAQWREYRKQSAAILKTYQDGVAIATAKGVYTKEAQDRQVAMHRANYDRAMAELKERAGSLLEAQRKLLAIEQRKAKGAKLEAKRALLGDQVLLRIYEKKIERASTAELAEWASASANEWESALLSELIPLELEGRRDKGSIGDQANVMLALNKLTDSSDPLVERERQLHRLGETLPELDPLAHSADMGARLGVSADAWLANMTQGAESASA